MIFRYHDFKTFLKFKNFKRILNFMWKISQQRSWNRDGNINIHRLNRIVYLENP